MNTITRPLENRSFLLSSQLDFKINVHLNLGKSQIHSLSNSTVHFSHKLHFLENIIKFVNVSNVKEPKLMWRLIAIKPVYFTGKKLKCMEIYVKKIVRYELKIGGSVSSSEYVLHTIWCNLLQTCFASIIVDNSIQNIFWHAHFYSVFFVLYGGIF